MLSARQAAFARSLLQGMSAAAAAREAGYSPKYADRQAHRLAKLPQVVAYLEELKAKADDESVMTARETLQRLTSIARGEGRIPRSTPNGIYDLPPDWTDRHRALDALAKHHGLYSDRRDNEPTPDLQDFARALDEARRLRQAERARTTN